jgi:hypothetical protein
VNWPGSTISPPYVGERECNRVAERFIRTLKIRTPCRMDSGVAQRSPIFGCASRRAAVYPGLHALGVCSRAPAQSKEMESGLRHWLGCTRRQLLGKRAAAPVAAGIGRYFSERRGLTLRNDQDLAQLGRICCLKIARAVVCSELCGGEARR